MGIPEILCADMLNRKKLSMYAYDMKKKNTEGEKYSKVRKMDPNSLIDSLDLLVADCLRTFVENEWIDDKKNDRRKGCVKTRKYCTVEVEPKKCNGHFLYDENYSSYKNLIHDMNMELCSEDAHFLKEKCVCLPSSLPSTAAVTPIAVSAFPSRSNTLQNSFVDIPDVLQSSPLQRLSSKLFIDESNLSRKNSAIFFANDYFFDWSEAIYDSVTESLLTAEESNYLTKERFMGRKVLHSAWDRPSTNSLIRSTKNISKIKDSVPRRRVLLRRGRTLVEDMKSAAERHYTNEIYFKSKDAWDSSTSTSVSRFDEIISSFIVHCYWGRNLILETIRHRSMNLLVRAAEELSKNCEATSPPQGDTKNLRSAKAIQKKRKVKKTQLNGIV